MEQKKRVGIWVRVSTDFQVLSDSPEVHEQRARYYAEAKGWEVIEVYRLEAVSGKTIMELPETKKMLRDIQTGRITALIFSKLARLARKTAELLEISELFRKSNADMISLAESIDTSTPSGRLFFTVVAAMAQWEREEISERVAASVPIRAKMGKPLGGQASFGYTWKGKELVIDTKEAPIRKMVHELFAEHKRKKTVAAKLNGMGYRTRNGSNFTNTTIGRLLRDTTAKGVRIANYTKSLGDGKKWVIKPESEWVTITCPAIVTEDLWEECNKILDQQEKKKKPTKKTVHLFTGILFCECGHKMLVPSDSKKYICNACKKNRITKDDLEEIYYENLKFFLLKDSDIEKFLSKADLVIAEKERQLQTFNQDKKHLQSEMDKTMQLYLAGQIPKDSFGKYFNPLDLQLKQIDNTIPVIQAEIDFMKIEYLNSDAIINEAQSLYDRWNTLDNDGKRTIVEQITDCITIGGDEIKIKFSYNPAFFRNAPDWERNLIPAFPFCGLEISALPPYLKGLDNPLVISDHLKKRRLQLRLLQADVAKIFDVCEDSITGWENGRSVPQIQYYPKLIEFLGYNPFPVETETLGGRIKKYRIEQGLSHKKFGEKIGVDASTIGAWEENEHTPTAKKMKILKQIFIH